MPKLTPKGKRSFTYSTIIVFILVVFALGYLFYFIPRNKSTLQKNGFIILRTISANFDSAVAARINLFGNFVRSPNSTRRSNEATQSRTNTIKRLLDENEINGSILIRHASKDSVAKAFDITDDSLTIEVEQGNNIFRFREPMDSFFEALVSSQKTELFTFYGLQILRKDNPSLVYHDKQLAVLNRLAGDSILSAGNGARVAGITDFSSENSDFKMFYYPFAVRGSSFVISGFVDSGRYNYILRQVPFYFIFPLVVVFLLVLIGLPVIKFYVMDSNEPTTMSDVFFFGGSAILGATLLSLMIIQFLLWKGEEIRIGQNLHKISSQITTSFFDEVGDATNEIVALDTFRRDSAAKNPDISMNVQDRLKNTKDSSHYPQFDRISWIDSSGWQRVKAELYKRPVYTNVGSRKYFTIFKTGIPYHVPGNEKAFGWEPIYSNTNGDLNISISMELRDTVVAMATKMYSLMQTIVPAGYGFCIIDADGNVQIHSETDRSLRENFLEKTDKPNEIRSFMLSRQSKIINNVSLYNKQCAILVQPLARTMPFYLVTFCDKTQLISVNMKILIFSVLLSVLFFAVVGIIWLAYGPKGINGHPLVYCKMDLLDWATPKRRLAPYYLHAFIYVAVYSLSMIGFVAFSSSYEINNVDMIALVLLTPYNIFVTLFCIRSAVDKNGTSRKSILQALIHLAVSFFIFYLRGPSFPLDLGFILFQVVVNIILWIYCGMNIKEAAFEDDGKIFFWKYKFLICSLVVCFSVLPAGIFTWYAHNQEITQNMKRQQLYLANSIKDRSSVIENSNQRMANLLQTPYFESLEFSRGIYRLFGDDIRHDPGKERRQRGTQFEEFYSSLMEKLAVTNYNKNSFPALQDTTYDHGWSWWISNDSLHFFWPSGQNRRDTAKDLSIASAIPPRFVFLTKERILPVAIIAVLLLIGLFKWMSGNAETIFLTNFIHRFKKKNITKDKQQEGQKKVTDDATDSLNSLSDYTRFKLGCSRGELVEYEQKLIRGMEAREVSYLVVWSSLTDKEKFLVYSFARDGIVNYKNIQEITNLLDKGILAVDYAAERLRISSPEFRAYVLSVMSSQQIKELQVTHTSDSTWRSVRVPLLILLLGIAALVFFTQHGIFEQLLLLAGGATTLINFMTGFFSGAGRKAAS